MELDKKSPIPLYLQLKEIVLEWIEKRELEPHDRLPSERELCNEFEISRMTVRLALGELAREGWVYTSMGKGTYVAEPKIDQELQTLTGFTEDMRRLDWATSTRVLEASTIPASTKLAAALLTSPGVEVVKLERLRLANGIPLALETAHIPHRLCPNILQYDFAARSLYEVFRKEYKLKLAKARQAMEAALANEREADLLGLSLPTPILLIERQTFLEDGRVIEYVKSAYRGDRYKFRTALFGTG